MDAAGGGDPMDTDATSGAGEDDDDDDSDDSEDERRGELAVLRKTTASNGVQGQQQQEEKSGLAFWHTYKYRPILGVVPLSDSAGLSIDGDSPLPLEVALIERPLWEVDMADRYYADGEREK